MSRNLVRSDYRSGNVAWADWILVTLLLVNGLWAIVALGNTPVGLPSLIGGLGFGLFVAVAESGKLTNA
ncbi:hypothetical protein ACNS7O_09235 [Haloferacaceae archaeon DSL9]